MAQRQTVGFSPPKLFFMITASLLLWFLLWLACSWMLQ